MTTVSCGIEGCESATEEWAPIPGWEDVYEVSDHGRVRSLDRVVVHSNGVVHRYRGRMMACPVNRRGRRAVNLKFQGRVVAHWVHSLVLQAFVGPRPSGFEGCHTDGNCLNDHLSNLRWDSSSENTRDSVRHRTHRMSQRTHCPSGHLLREPNLVRSMLSANSSRPGRKCKACHRAQATISNARRDGRVPGERQEIADDHYARIMGERRAS